MIDETILKTTIIEELGLSSFPKEKQDELIARIGKTILTSLTIALFDALPEEVRDEFKEISESGDTERMQSFLETHIPNTEEFIKKEIKKTIDEIK